MTAAIDRFAPIHVAPAYQQVAEAIEREIVTGRIRPGEPIGTEAQLVKQFGVNRSTVREGIRLLEQGGLIRRDPSRRLLASLPRYNRLATRISRALVLHEVTFRELFEASMALEVASVEQAVEHVTDAQLAELDLNQARMQAAIGDPAALSELDTEFHTLIAKASANRVLQLAREPASLLFFPTTELICRFVAEGPARMIEAHGRLIDALRRRDAEAARLWMRRHVKDWGKGFERAGRELDQPIERVFMNNLMLSNTAP